MIKKVILSLSVIFLFISCKKEKEIIYIEKETEPSPSSFLDRDRIDVNTSISYSLNNNQRSNTIPRIFRDDTIQFNFTFTSNSKISRIEFWPIIDNKNETGINYELLFKSKGSSYRIQEKFNSYSGTLENVSIITDPSNYQAIFPYTKNICVVYIDSLGYADIDTILNLAPEEIQTNNHFRIHSTFPHNKNNEQKSHTMFSSQNIIGKNSNNIKTHDFIEPLYSNDSIYIKGLKLSNNRHSLLKIEGSFNQYYRVNHLEKLHIDQPININTIDSAIVGDVYAFKYENKWIRSIKGTDTTFAGDVYGIFEITHIHDDKSEANQDYIEIRSKQFLDESRFITNNLF